MLQYLAARIDLWHQIRTADLVPENVLSLPPTASKEGPAERRMGDAKIYVQPAVALRQFGWPVVHH